VGDPYDPSPFVRTFSSRNKQQSSIIMGRERE
jgi:hypothetical protein